MYVVIHKARAWILQKKMFGHRSMVKSLWISPIIWNSEVICSKLFIKIKVGYNAVVDEQIAQYVKSGLNKLDDEDTQNVQQLPQILEKKEMKKYWAQCYKLFSKFDKGIQLDYGTCYRA